MIWRRQLRWGRFWWACDWILAIAVVWGSLTPGNRLPHAVGFFNDKVLHFGAYLIMGLWFAGSVERRLYPLIAVLLCILGGAIEIVQYYMGFGRDADWMDFWADVGGVALAMALAYGGLGNWMAWIEQRFGRRG